MLKVKSQSKVKRLAEMKDISAWPVEKEKTDFKPGVFYAVGKITQNLTYTLSDGVDGSEWRFSVITGPSSYRLVHPTGVKSSTNTSLPSNSRIEFRAIQEDGVKYLHMVSSMSV